MHLVLLQVMARVVSHGPDGRMLNATFREADKLEYQDSLGRLTLEVAQSVPDGVLLFLPSYSLMDKLRERWKVGLHFVAMELLLLCIASLVLTCAF
jgi:Fanconi anemia group J protein